MHGRNNSHNSYKRCILYLCRVQALGVLLRAAATKCRPRLGSFGSPKHQVLTQQMLRWPVLQVTACANEQQHHLLFETFPNTNTCQQGNCVSLLLVVCCGASSCYVYRNFSTCCCPCCATSPPAYWCSGHVWIEMCDSESRNTQVTPSVPANTWQECPRYVIAAC
jgi:hypothetical protein